VKKTCWREYEYQFGFVSASCQLPTCHKQYFALSANFPKRKNFLFIDKKYYLSFLVNKLFFFTTQAKAPHQLWKLEFQ